MWSKTSKHLFSFLTIHSQIVDSNALQMRHVSKGRENDKTCQDTGEGVDDGYCQGVPVGKEDGFFMWFSYCPEIIIVTAGVGKVSGRGFWLITSERCCWRSCSWTWPRGSRNQSRWSWRSELQHSPTPATQRDVHPETLMTADHCQYQSPMPRQILINI